MTNLLERVIAGPLPFRLAAKLWSRMTMSPEDRDALDELEVRIRAILPEEYRDSYDEVQPVSMGSASLRYDPGGKVAWNEIWGSFCDLAMAGGPPHKGTLLQPGSRSEIEAHPEAHQNVVEELCRGIKMVADLPAERSPIPGWVRVECPNEGMAGWLARAIVMENVSARCGGKALELPAGPGYRIEKEIKNVITSTAKACHYWAGHMWTSQQRFIGNLFLEIAAESLLIQPALEADAVLCEKMEAAIHQATGLGPSSRRYPGWLGITCPDIHFAIWMMRALVASNVFSRREEETLFVAVNPAIDPDGESVVRSVIRVHRFATRR